MSTIVINATNAVAGSGNAAFRVNFPQTIPFVNKQIGVQSIDMFYSWFNISAAKGNNSLSYIWTDGTVGYLGQTRGNLAQHTLPDGNYNIDRLNAALEAAMFANGHFLFDSNGNPYYYMRLIENATYYAVEFDSNPIPASLPSGFSIGTVNLGASFWLTSNWPSYPTAGLSLNPQLSIPTSINANPLPLFGQSAYFNTDTMASILGMGPGLYPLVNTGNASFSFLSTSFSGNPTGYPPSFVPEVNQVQALLVTCSLLANNQFNAQPNSIAQFVSGDTAFGGLINVMPPEIAWCDIDNNLRTDSMTITFVDQNFRPVSILDPQVTITLGIRDKSSNYTFTPPRI